MKKFFIADWKEKKKDIEEKLGFLFDKISAKTKLDVENDNVTYFREVKEAKAYIDTEALGIDGVEEAYYDMLTDTIEVYAFFDEDIEEEAKTRILLQLKGV